MWLSESGEKEPKEYEAAWKEMLAASDEETKERCMKAYREEKRKVKRCMLG